MKHFSDSFWVNQYEIFESRSEYNLKTFYEKKTIESFLWTIWI